MDSALELTYKVQGEVLRKRTILLPMHLRSMDAEKPSLMDGVTHTVVDLSPFHGLGSHSAEVIA